MTRVFDIHGQEQTLDWLADRYDGCGVLEADTYVRHGWWDNVSYVTR